MKRAAIATVGSVAVALAFGAAGLYLGTKTTSPQAPASQTETDPVKALLTQPMATPEGAVQSLAQWKGRTIVVNFWATWCAPCVEEMPALSAMQQTLSPQTVQIIGIGIDTAANIKAFIALHHIAYPNYVASTTGMESMQQLGNKIGGLPYSVLIDGNGKVVRTYLGKLDMDALRRDIAALPPNT